jgi:hypothetical protein
MILRGGHSKRRSPKIDLQRGARLYIHDCNYGSLMENFRYTQDVAVRNEWSNCGSLMETLFRQRLIWCVFNRRHQLFRWQNQHIHTASFHIKHVHTMSQLISARAHVAGSLNFTIGAYTSHLFIDSIFYQNLNMSLRFILVRFILAASAKKRGMLSLA